MGAVLTALAYRRAINYGIVDPMALRMDYMTAASHLGRSAKLVDDAVDMAAALAAAYGKDWPALGRGLASLVGMGHCAWECPVAAAFWACAMPAEWRGAAKRLVGVNEICVTSVDKLRELRLDGVALPKLGGAVLVEGDKRRAEAGGVWKLGVDYDTLLTLAMGQAACGAPVTPPAGGLGALALRLAIGG